MSAQQNAGFGQFIPGFDFLQNLAKGSSAAMPQMPNLSSWVAPTLNLQELEKRIGELKAVQFWLEQNRTALGATIQALEVQRMTLATLKGMNMNMADIADAMTLKAGSRGAGAAEAAGAKPKAATAAQAEPKEGGDASKVVDPMQWWGALTQQFQQIAATAMQDVAASADAAKKAKAGKATAGAGAAPAPAAAKRPAKAKRPSRKASAG